MAPLRFYRLAPKVPAGSAVGRQEAPCGEVFYAVTANEPISAKGKDSYSAAANMPSMQWALIGVQLADAPLVQASIDPCYPALTGDDIPERRRCKTSPLR